MYAGEELIGLLYVDNPVTRQFSEADLELFSAIANYAAVAITQGRLAERLREESERRERLQRYHSPAVVDRIMARRGADGDAVLAAQDREISVLFADIVGFTALAESLAPSEVATLLNRFFSEMTEAIFAEEGTVDKFIGDAILAVFGAPVEQPDHAAARGARGAGDAARGRAPQRLGRPPFARALRDQQRDRDRWRRRIGAAPRIHRARRRRQHGVAARGARGAGSDPGQPRDLRPDPAAGARDAARRARHPRTHGAKSEILSIDPD